MGLKDVLQRMKLVEVEDRPATRAPSRGPAPPARPSTSRGAAEDVPWPAAGAGPASSRPAAPDPNQAPATSAASRETLAQVLDALPPREPLDDRVLAPQALTGDEEPDFPALYRAAGVREPAHGFTALKVLELLSSPHLAALQGEARAAAVLGFLQMNPAGSVPVRDVIEDAVARDEALDACEQALQRRWAARSAEVERENAALQAEIDAVTERNRARIQANRAQLEAERAQLARWQERKRAEERRLFDAVAPFVEDNPVTAAARADGGGTSNPSPAPA